MTTVAFASAPTPNVSRLGSPTGGPGFGSATLGNVQEQVRLFLGPDRLEIATDWTVNEAVFSQPARFQVTVGTNLSPASFLAKYPPRTPFRLYVGSALQMTGQLDGRGARMGPQGTIVRLRGRDALAPLLRSYVEVEETYSDSTYSDLVRRHMKAAGLDPNLLVVTDANIANRKVKAGFSVRQMLPARTVDQILADDGTRSTSSFGGAQASELKAKPGTKRLVFLRKHLDRAGLCLWAAADGKFVLSIPNSAQLPTYRLLNRRGQAPGSTNVLDYDWNDDATNRHAGAIMYGRGGGKKFGRAKSKGTVDDPEMIGWGYTERLVLRDPDIQTEAQAVYFGFRKLAEARRDGWTLSYSVAGHTLPAIGGGQATITVDTTVEVIDEEIGLKGVFYIEELERKASPHTYTNLKLVRTSDIVLGPDSVGSTSSTPTAGGVGSGFQLPAARDVATILAL